MKLHNFARRLSPFLTVYLLLVSLGLPLHKIYCACRGESEISLFSPEHACGHDAVVLADNSEGEGRSAPATVAVLDKEQEPAPPAVTEKASCCSSKESACLQTEVSGENHSCGDNEETILAKLTTDYLVKEQDYAQLLTATALPIPSLQDELPALVVAEKATPIRGPTPPPLPYGRELLLRHQLFLC
ncbi:hypothetical protein CEQ90_14820 [Lewinellaceae bacterium SD302]|nr:hypothetical protein CEQ90_14820 [Lewinellaceae bacterium SD302]